ncbi:MAG: copper-binding protein [Piscinibacter sp.]|uniref:copper-binding protein n=1 Tax=Piscinibacter sp. TaxID=1903157 RepID=UPI00258F168B|nr:copper-binding protein [Piscinibacter sp.]MCW5663080.1 copper-binding protein [Piscinibacter sp.]
MKKLLSVTLLALASLSTSRAWSADDYTDAKVRRVDKSAATLTLEHGEIRNLDMPPMTMVFGVQDKAVLERVKAGDRIRFKAVKDGSKYIVTELQPAAK